MTKRQLQVVLGILWIFDGLLQLQPKMFSAKFAENVILPAANHQPAFVSIPIHWVASVFLLNPVLFNSLIVVTQLTIGLLILSKRTVKLGLILSVVWGVVVWIIGEGYGGIFSGQFSLLMGGPGAAIIYSILAVAAYPKSVDNQPAYWLSFVWCGLWLAGAATFLFTQHSISSLQSMSLQSAAGAPGWLSAIDKHLADYIGGISTGSSIAGTSSMAMASPALSPGYWLILLIGLVEISVGIGVFIKGNVRKISLILAFAMLILFWFVGQQAGNYYSGLMTDPNTAPLLILMGLVLFTSNFDEQIAQVGSRIKEVII